jgi:hypothetical protein
MRAIANIIHDAFEAALKGHTTASEPNNEIRLMPENISDAIVKRIHRVPAIEPEVIDQWLEIGEGSSFESALTPFDQIVIRIAKCSGHSGGKKYCVTEDELKKAISSFRSKDDAYRATYLLVAAVRNNDFEGHDPARTGPKRYQEHFEKQKQGAWQDFLRQYVRLPDGTPVNPGELKVEGPSKGKCGLEFAESVETNARTIQADVERIACAFPSFLHVPPYWHWLDLLSGTDLSLDENNPPTRSREPTEVFGG